MPSPGQHGTGSLWRLTLGSIGVVYGDIGTSPIYAMREFLHAVSGDGLTRADVIGVISLLIWTLIFIVSFKYVILVMRADNRGEGGTLSLVALIASMGVEAAIPSNRSHRQAIPHDAAARKSRNRIKRCFNRMKPFRKKYVRRFATRLTTNAPSTSQASPTSPPV